MDCTIYLFCAAAGFALPNIKAARITNVYRLRFISWVPFAGLPRVFISRPWDKTMPAKFRKMRLPHQWYEYHFFLIERNYSYLVPLYHAGKT